MTKERSSLIAYSTAHLLVDAVCACLLFGPAAASLDGKKFALLILLYNTLAFTTQCIVGYVTDRKGSCRTNAAVSCALIGIVWFLPVGSAGKVVAAALGAVLVYVLVILAFITGAVILVVSLIRKAKKKRK